MRRIVTDKNDFSFTETQHVDGFSSIQTWDGKTGSQVDPV